jgi:transcriptional regulator with PAS, ATPase and Fis domain
MQIPEWAREFDGAVTVCDVDGVILYMNAKAERTFTREGGTLLVGKNVLDCHPEPARSKLLALLQTGKSNVYTIEKNGVKKLIYQSPWYENGEYRGLVELSLELPAEIPHFVRG